MAVERAETGPFVFHWSAILGGSFVALGVWMFLYALGAAIGGAATKPRPDAWTAVYTLASPIIALFVGGLVTSRARGVVNRGDAALHGAIMWGFSMVVGGFIAGVVSSLALLRTGTNVPAGYSWAIAGAILGSLITAVAGATYGVREFEERRTIVSQRREVTP